MSPAPYAAVWQRPETLRGLLNSFLVATISATLVAMLTLILAWVVIRRREAVRWVLDFTASPPLVFPGIVRQKLLPMSVG